MGRDKGPANLPTFVLSKHAFFDLSHVSPFLFLYLLKACYAYGTCKASVKFRALQRQVYLVLLNNYQIGPATFIARCLYILPAFESYCDGFSHLVISAVRRYLKLGFNVEDREEARIWAAKLFLDIVGGTLVHDEGVLIKIIQAFDVSLLNIEKAISNIHINRNSNADTAKYMVEEYVKKLIELGSYMTAVDILMQFSIHHSGESFLLKLMECHQFKAAEKWATFMGKTASCFLVKKYVELNLLQPAYDVIRKNNLRHEFPELYHQSKESSLKKLAEKGVWEIAEARANNDRQLLEYLVYLAMEAGYFEKVEELCERYSLEGFLNFKEPDANILQGRYLDLHELCIEDIVWVDEVNILHDATCYLEECKVLGLDCEWKPIYEKGKGPCKVSIMQIASEKKVYILDLIRLTGEVPSVLDNCLARILRSPSILKLGYNFQCDVRQLAHSYGELHCFKHFEMLLDIQNVFREPRGGLSGLAEKILGAGLNKTRRNSNWEQRPLSLHQLEYAALDAAVLIHIFRHVGSHTHPACDPDGHANIEWKSHIVSHMDNSKSSRKDKKTGEGIDAGRHDELS